MPGGLPQGTVTFMFTDVEGSTGLLGELGAEAFAAALDEHRLIVRSALAEHGGVEVDTQGDAFFCVFASAVDAVACATAVQDSLSPTSVRVRIGLHSGEALVAAGRYVGLEVHRAARIGASGHGGQVVISDTTVALLPSGSVSLRDLGDHRLKDLPAPVRLHQLGPAEFPPLKTLYRASLPIPATPFLGRRRDVSELLDRVQSGRARLLTLTGPGGTGKTRLALEAARELAAGFADGTFWVPLASLRDHALVASAVAGVLRVDEETGASLPETIAATVGAKTMLVLLDNCEHVLDGVAEVVAELLRAAPNVVVLATSREPLSLAGEEIFAVDPLERADAVALFTARAQAAGGAVADADLDAVSRLCARLDDLPLAVELAAARAATLPVTTLLERLADRLDLLRGPRDADERQRTLRATIDWSYDLLDEEERRVFRSLAVFAGSAALDAVERVCETELDVALSLVAKSLLRQQLSADAAPRYWLLETVRELAAERLQEAGEEAGAGDRHRAWFAELAAEAWPSIQLGGSHGWLERLESDRENLRLAFGHACEAATAVEGAQGLTELAVALSALHDLHGRYAEEEETLGAALGLETDQERRALLTSRLARNADGREATIDAGRLHAEAVALLGADPVENAGAERRGTWIDVKLAQAHHYYWVGDHPALRAVADELAPLVDAYGGPAQRSDFHHVRLQEAFRREQYVLSAESEETARAMYAAAQATREPDLDFQFGFAMLWRGNLAEAIEHLDLGLQTARRLGDVVQEVRRLAYGAVACRKSGDVEAVRDRLAQLDALEDVYGYVGLHAATHAWLAWRDGRFDDVVRHAATALADWNPANRTRQAGIFQWTARFPLLAVELRRGNVDAATEHATVMLGPHQQPLPTDLGEALRANRLVEAVELGKVGGYT